MLSEEEGHAPYLKDDYDPSVFEILEESRKLVEVDYSNAIYEKCGQSVIDNILIELKEYDSQIKLAYHYICSIDDELAKGDKSALRIDHKATKTAGYLLITISSFQQWALDKHNIDIFQLGQSAAEDHIKPHNDEAKNLQITFAILVVEFAGAHEFMTKDQKPKVIAIARYLEGIAKNYSEDLIGQKETTIRDRINGAFKIKSGNPGPVLSKTIVKGLQITFAFLVDEYAKIKFDDIANVAEHLASLGGSLPHQSQSDIEARINLAMDVRENRDKR